jgi:hypothetical protein
MGVSRLQQWYRHAVEPTMSGKVAKRRRVRLREQSRAPAPACRAGHPGGRSAIRGCRRSTAKWSAVVGRTGGLIARTTIPRPKISSVEDSIRTDHRQRYLSRTDIRSGIGRGSGGDRSGIGNLGGAPPGTKKPAARSRGGLCDRAAGRYEPLGSRCAARTVTGNPFAALCVAATTCWLAWAVPAIWRAAMEPRRHLTSSIARTQSRTT